MDKECDEMTKSDFRRWERRNFHELKEHVLNQCKETKNLEKRFEKKFEEMITKMDNLKKNMNESKELENTTQELHEACTSLNSRIDKAEKKYQKSKINSIK